MTQILPNVPWGTESSLIENHWQKVIVSSFLQISKWHSEKLNDLSKYTFSLNDLQKWHLWDELNHESLDMNVLVKHLSHLISHKRDFCMPTISYDISEETLGWFCHYLGFFFPTKGKQAIINSKLEISLMKIGLGIKYIHIVHASDFFQSSFHLLLCKIYERNYHFY